MAQEIVPWVIGANALLSMAALLYSWFSSGNAKAMKRLEKVEAALEKVHDEWEDRADRRSKEFRDEFRLLFNEVRESTAAASARTSMMERAVAVFESRLEHLPSSATTQRMEIAIARVEGRLDTLAERIQPVAAVASRLQEQAMEEARR